jgi:hypothetical protein
MLTQQEPDINFENARRTHHEYYAPALVNAWWLRVFCAGLILAVLVLAVGSLRTAKQIAKQRVIVLSAARDGSFDQTQYVNIADYQPSDKVIEHFAYVWAVKYYSRVRATIADDWTESLKFFSTPMVSELKTEAERSQWIQAFQQSSDPEVRIEVKKVRLEKGAITIDFDKHFYLAGQEVMGKAENWTSQIPYTLTPVAEVTTGMIPVNPIGLKITTRPLETKGF